MLPLPVYAIQALHGIVYGMLLFLVSAGLTLVFGIKAWEGSKFKTVWGGEVEMRACDHQMLTQGYLAEVLEADKIPPELRHFGNEFPFLGRPTSIPRDEITVPPRETGNKRCA
jgi:hypothetical protein